MKKPKQTKTLNVEEAVHQRVKVAAAIAGCDLGTYADAVIQVGLAHPREITRLLAGDTKSERRQEKE
jgi:transaldolase